MLKLSDCLNEKYIKLNLNAENKDEMLKEMAEILRENISDFDKFMKDLYNREDSGSTAMEFGYAIPHVRTSAINGFYIAVGTKPSGINCDSIDKKDSTLFFLIATNEEFKNEHIGSLVNIAKILNSEIEVDILTNTKSREGFIDIIRQMEQK